MFIKRNLFLLFLVTFLITGCGRGIRWKHPTPSNSLVITALKEAQNIRDINGKDINLEYISSLNKLVADEKQADFFLATIDSDLIITTKGFTRNDYIVGLGFPEYFIEKGIPYKPTKGFAFQYKGKIKGVTFSLPHMTDHENTRDDLILHTDPLTPFKVIVIYQDGTTAQFDVKSKRIKTRLGGGFSSTLLDSFDGRLWLNLDKFQHYYVYMPYGM